MTDPSSATSGDAVEDHGHDRLVGIYGICTVCAIDVAKAALGDTETAPRPGPAGWHARARKAIRHLAETRDEFTADDVWTLVPRPPNPKLLGPLMVEAAEAGLIVRTDRTVESTGALNHRRPVRVWEPAQRHLV